MNSTSLTKPVDLQGLSLALAKTKADYEAQIDYYNSKPFYVEITDDMESEEEFAWLSDKTYSEIDFANGKGIPIYFRYGDYEGKAIRDYDGNFYAMCFDFTSATDTLMGVRIEIDSEDNVNVINDINIPNITSIPQSDWNETDTTDNDYILNKPAIKAGEGENSVLIGDSEQLSNAAIYDITISGDANTTTYTYTTEATIATPNKSNYILFYSDKFYPLRDMTDSVLTLFSSIGNTAISNADAKLYYKYKTASGVDSIAEGQGTVASGQRSHAEGAGSKATGSYSHAEGMNAISNGTASHSEGLFTKSLSSATHTEGYGTEALVLYSHAEGNLSVANGQGSHSEGYKTETNGNYAHSEGKYTNADGLSSHSEGYASTAIGYGSHSEGFYAVYHATLTGEANTLTYTVTNSTLKLRSADRAKSLIVYVGSSEWAVESATLDSNGYLTSVTLEKTIGGSTSYPADIRISPCANKHGSHAEGMATFTNANAAHAEGLGTEALGEASHTEGLQTIAGSSHQHVQGKYNIEDSSNTYADIVGNGTDSNTRSNAYTLDWNGNGWYAGKLTVGAAPVNDMDVATKQYVDENIPQLENDIFKVYITYDSEQDKYIADKTYNEIYQINVRDEDEKYKTIVFYLDGKFLGYASRAIDDRGRTIFYTEYYHSIVEVLESFDGSNIKTIVAIHPDNSITVTYSNVSGGSTNVVLTNTTGVGNATVGTTAVNVETISSNITYQKIFDDNSHDIQIYFNYYDYHGQAYKNSDGSFSAICFKSNDLEKTEGIKIIYKSDGTITSSRFYIPVPEDDINVLNLLSDYGFVSPISDASGNVIVDVDGNLILG